MKNFVAFLIALAVILGVVGITLAFENKLDGLLGGDDTLVIKKDDGGTYVVDNSQNKFDRYALKLGEGTLVSEYSMVFNPNHEQPFLGFMFGGLKKNTTYKITWKIDESVLDGNDISIITRELNGSNVYVVCYSPEMMAPEDIDDTSLYSFSSISSLLNGSITVSTNGSDDVPLIGFFNTPYREGGSTVSDNYHEVQQKFYNSFEYLYVEEVK